MVTKKLMCQTCANQVKGHYCTRQKKMHWKSMIYKKCNGYKQYVAPPIKPEVIKKERPINYEELGQFGKFLQNGGHYSFRTGKFIGVNY